MGIFSWSIKKDVVDFAGLLDEIENREAFKHGVLTFGIVMKNEDSSHYNFYCPDKIVWEETGYFNENPGGDS